MAAPHVFHGRFVGAALGFEQVGMAFVAAEIFYVGGVRESGVADVFGLVDNVAGMAGGAIGCDAERLLAVVAGPTGSAPFHLFHGGVIAVVLLFEDFPEAFQWRLTTCEPVCGKEKIELVEALSKVNYINAVFDYELAVATFDRAAGIEPNIPGVRNDE